MSKSAVIHTRIDPQLKAEVETILETLGLSTSQLITLLYRQIVFKRGLPFEVNVPNELTIRTFETTDAGEEVMRFDSAEAMFNRLGI